MVTFTVVSKSEAKQKPYPYVWVDEEGGVRELAPHEKEFLETPFIPGDGGAPATKSDYHQKNGWGNLRGFCKRLHIPEGIEIQPYE
ncbi:MAG TPA: hypothetical protein VLA32_00855 [Anaerolineales bacterium]|jgi:hypothetical protein|nr:hypothetical protein [Anaerolineales bacterium]